ncbi:hypothetical protein LEP1GSC021_2429 [Leptospira noguchii str. 1993005606]|uniref:Uncharacterized protein n=2 Tax=Leptospira noguchii TaxID=28182 RepID=M6Y6E8_9LEPT|nr:hypothetical protein LEP1GSC035_0429 [Leptospira noguchii str. 2007001578]EMO89295.1 hypothetical protein LEP1GSC024_4006 [Leptospira noguchii str. 2001034031]EPE83008.1 hypothetical protein LEP1GSC021_2429 [Leptospira noguchii str. 1993005606]
MSSFTSIHFASIYINFNINSKLHFKFFSSLEFYKNLKFNNSTKKEFFQI